MADDLHEANFFDAMQGERKARHEKRRRCLICGRRMSQDGFQLEARNYGMPLYPEGYIHPSMGEIHKTCYFRRIEELYS